MYKYDMIIGNDLLEKLKIDLKYSTSATIEIGWCKDSNEVMRCDY